MMDSEKSTEMVSLLRGAGIVEHVASGVDAQQSDSLLPRFQSALSRFPMVVAMAVSGTASMGYVQQVHGDQLFEPLSSEQAIQYEMAARFVDSLEDALGAAMSKGIGAGHQRAVNHLESERPFVFERDAGLELKSPALILSEFRGKEHLAHGSVTTERVESYQSALIDGLHEALEVDDFGRWASDDEDYENISDLVSQASEAMARLGHAYQERMAEPDPANFSRLQVYFNQLDEESPLHNEVRGLFMSIMTEQVRDDSHGMTLADQVIGELEEAHFNGLTLEQFLDDVHHFRDSAQMDGPR